MDKNKIISLLKLLEDPDEKVFSIVKDKILSYGELFKIYLENYHTLSINELALQRSEDILDEIFWENFKTKFTEYLTNPKANFAKGVFLIEKFFNRDIDIKEISKKYEEIKTSVWIEFNEYLTNIEKIRILNTVIFKQLGFKKLKSNEMKSDALSITYCISNKRFLAPNIALLYCMLSDELQIPVFPTNLQDLFVLCYCNQDIQSKISENKTNDIIFFLYPYEEGAILPIDIAAKHFENLKQKIETTKTIDEVEPTNYNSFLFNYFTIRIITLRIAKIENFSTKYYEKLESIFKKYL
ncbi:MAG: transglutaminase-like domain-containing protein [Bacteroidales bacterium]|nr:transglutaminase-like domain-containing protein [Bacteroidales bacterium]MCK9499461.1 transglutaminase-like domain-containing protein [Bacteroidales bacterium]MDY0315817.1 transglutaminase family protein [Bacteroidales bacterium]